MAQRGEETASSSEMVVTDHKLIKLKLKLMVNRHSRRVIFAEAGKEAIDLLLYLVSLPLASITRLLSPEGMVGSLGKLYASVHSLDDAFLIHPSKDRKALLNPKLPSTSAFPQTTAALLLQNDPTPTTEVYYRCSTAHRGSPYKNYVGYSRNDGHVTDACGTACPLCGKPMDVVMRFAPGAADAAAEKARADAGGGYVRPVKYMVMDDLAVMPMSTVSAISVLNKLHVTDTSLVDERAVELGMKEVLELLKTSLQSKTVLTDVFCKQSRIGLSRGRTTRKRSRGFAPLLSKSEYSEEGTES